MRLLSGKGRFCFGATYAFNRGPLPRAYRPFYPGTGAIGHNQCNGVAEGRADFDE